MELFQEIQTPLAKAFDILIDRDLLEDDRFIHYRDSLKDLGLSIITLESEVDSERPLLLMFDFDKEDYYCKKYRGKGIRCFFSFGLGKTSKLSNLFNLDFSDDREFIYLLERFSHKILCFQTAKTKEDSYQRYFEIIKNAETFLKTMPAESSKKDAFLFLKQIRESHFDDNNFIEQVRSCLEIIPEIIGIELVEEDRIYELSLNPYNILVPVSNLTSKDFLCFGMRNDNLDNITCYHISLIVEELEKLLLRKEEISSLNHRNDISEESFSKIPFPLALISNSGELLLHNSGFSKLRILPKECLPLEDGDEIESGIIYKVRKIQLESEKSFFIFTSDKLHEGKFQNKNISSEELGIISSSVAHELNNPLAGILAALTLLELEDVWDQEAKSSLSEMKSGALRCKELIEIFLGFSKVSLNDEAPVDLFYTFQKSLELLRFRMIESEILLDIRMIEKEQSFSRRLNSSIVTMIFYLILSEMMTNFFHQQLVEKGDGETDDKTIFGSFIQLKDRLEIRLENELSNIDNIQKSKLIKHLVELEGMKLVLSPSCITLLAS